jgi:transcriptional regulator with GAF, ATPase, and Fis domain
MRDVPVLLTGESGTGKEMFARAIHEASHRRNRPFLAINCAAIPTDLLESELFGHVKGAFTGATSDHPGAFEMADGGTLFLDEVGECESAMQAKLLRVLQPPEGAPPCGRTFRRVGASEDSTSDVRVIAATNQDLVERVNQNRFREDLYYRLAVITVKLPPLRERKSDISLLVDALLKQINAEFGREEPGYRDKSLSASAIAFVRQYHWPGNVRQLHNALVQAAVLADGDEIHPSDLSCAVADFPEMAHQNPLDHELGSGFSLPELLEDIQRHYLQRAMAEAKGVKTKAAQLVGYANYQTLDAQLRRLGGDEEGAPDRIRRGRRLRKHRWRRHMDEGG